MRIPEQLPPPFHCGGMHKAMTCVSKFLQITQLWFIAQFSATSKPVSE
jgi:hypothetical protein